MSRLLSFLNITTNKDNKEDKINIVFEDEDIDESSDEEDI